MVFCYKLITESPRRFLCTSPSKSPDRRYSNVPASSSYESNDDLLDLIPERDWKLLAALARKREEVDERERLAEEFQKMWMKEKEERETAGAEMSAQYKRYLHQKRSQERRYLEYKRRERTAELNARRANLINAIHHKELRSADLLANTEDRKITEILEKAIVEDTRAQVAAERRSMISAAEDWKKQLELADGIKKANDAGEKRNTRLREASQRLAINRALSTWETMLIRQDVAVEEAIRRAHAMASTCLVEARSARQARARAARTRRARHVAAVTAHMRDLLKRGV